MAMQQVHRMYIPLILGHPCIYQADNLSSLTPPGDASIYSIMYQAEESNSDQAHLPELLLATHRELHCIPMAVRRTRPSQPVLVQIDSARADGIGASGSRHGARWQQDDRRQCRKIPSCPLADQRLQLRWPPRKPEGSLGSGAQEAIGSPLAELLLPLLVQGWRERGSGKHRS
jgi:hypothetical protein